MRQNSRLKNLCWVQVEIFLVSPLLAVQLVQHTSDLALVLAVCTIPMLGGRTAAVTPPATRPHTIVMTQIKYVGFHKILWRRR